MDGSTLKRLKELLLRKQTAVTIALINLLGTVFGFYYYLPQLREVSPHLWIFVADSPIATLAIALSLILYIYGRNLKFLNAFAFISNLKYGLWTVFVLLYYFESFWATNSMPMYIFLLGSHFLMFVQAFLVLDYSDFSWSVFSISAVWFLLNDTLDYFLDIHPTLFVEHSHPVNAAMVSAYILTFLSLSCYLLFLSSLSEHLRQTHLLQHLD